MWVFCRAPPSLHDRGSPKLGGGAGPGGKFPNFLLRRFPLFSPQANMGFLRGNFRARDSEAAAAAKKTTSRRAASKASAEPESRKATMADGFKVSAPRGNRRRRGGDGEEARGVRLRCRAGIARGPLFPLPTGAGRGLFPRQPPPPGSWTPSSGRRPSRSREATVQAPREQSG